MIDTKTGLQAREDVRFVLDNWSRLRGKVQPGSSSAVERMRSGGESGIPINVYVSDLMLDIEQNAFSYVRIILDEDVQYQPRHDSMPGLLQEIIDRYGHFVCDEDEKVAIDFCDWAHETRRKVERVLQGPVPMVYLGECRVGGCSGEIRSREDRREGTCPECGEPWTMDEQREWLAEALADRLMTTSEIVHGLKVAGVGVQRNTLRAWIKRKRLQPVVDEGEDVRLYSFADAYALACRVAS